MIHMGLRPSSLPLKKGIEEWDGLTNSLHLQICSDGVNYRPMIISSSRTYFI